MVKLTISTLLIPVISLLVPLEGTGQEAGPVIPEYGKVYTIQNAALPASTAASFKAVFDVYDSPAGGNGTNPQLETAARFLNMHARAGVAPEKLNVALVVHGKASEDLLKPEAFLKKHGMESPNADLVRKLLDAGVQIAICGQSATSRKISQDQTIPGVLWSLSAMTALIHYQDEGYRFIKF